MKKKSIYYYNDFLKFYGKKNLKKYRDVLPFLYLLYYRTEVWPDGLFNGDNYTRVFSKGIIKQLLKLPIFIINLILEKKVHKSESILISRTFVDIDRYKDNLEEAYKKKNILVPLSLQHYSVRKREENLYNYIYFPFGISGLFTKAVFSHSLEYIRKKKEAGTFLSYEKVKDQLFLQMLRLVIEKRSKKIAKILKRNNVKSFITINQYDLADYLCIKACNMIGAKTKEMCHGLYCILPVCIYDFVTYTDQRCVWNDAEKNFCEKYYKGVSFAKKTEIVSVGSPEINYTVLKKRKKRIAKKNSLLLMIKPAVLIMDKSYIKSYDDNVLQQVSDYRKGIAKQISEFGKKYGFKLFAKYHPSEYSMFYDIEKGMMDSYGIEIVENSAHALSEKLCECKVVLGFHTTALVLALGYGCKVYNIVNDKYLKYDYYNLNIENVFEDEINKINYIDEKNNREEEYEKMLSLNIDKLFD